MLDNFLKFLLLVLLVLILDSSARFYFFQALKKLEKEIEILTDDPYLKKLSHMITIFLEEAEVLAKIAIEDCFSKLSDFFVQHCLPSLEGLYFLYLVIRTQWEEFCEDEERMQYLIAESADIYAYVITPLVILYILKDYL